MTPEAVAMALVVPCVLGLVWLVRLEGRVNGHDKDNLNREKELELIRGDIRYIRERIDRAITGE